MMKLLPILIMVGSNNFVSKIKIKKNKYRQLEIKTNHGKLVSPFFLPDATRGFIKLTDNKEIKQSKTKALMVNTFHLYLQAKTEIIKKAHGLHNFMAWSNPLMSDSGGFQIFSLIHKKKILGKIGDREIEFKSPIDGSSHKLSPEKSIKIQFDLGTDIMVCLDDCPPHESDNKSMKQSVETTISWAKRAKIEYLKQIKKRKIKQEKRPLLLAVIQGGLDIDLRKYCAKKLVEIGFDGYGLGARPVDENGVFLTKVLKETALAIPENSLRFALGVGMPEDIYRSYILGWDAFDCVIPSREGRHGRIFYFKPKFQGFSPILSDFYKTINIKNKQFSTDFSPINNLSEIKLLRDYSKAFLHYLFRLNDPLGQKLASLNNLEFYQNLIKYLKKLK
jgi:queuine tRNA-ribosyltransferase